MRALAAGRLTATAPGVADAHTVVELQVAALVLAHVAALYVAHLRALGALGPLDYCLGHT
jgi:hypothetical protein